MKRYRVLGYDIDSRAALLSMEISKWAAPAKKSWEGHQKAVLDGLKVQYGAGDLAQKVQNFIDLGNSPHCIVAFHNKFLRQIRTSFVIGAYYPALTGACALGERILNHLMLLLRDHFKSTPEYKHIYRKQSFDDWNLAIDTLASWGVLLPNVETHYRLLREKRNDAIHFRPDVDTNDRLLALEAIDLLSEIIGEQFGGGTGGYFQPWFIPKSRGSFYLKKEWEEEPFIKEVYLPNCVLVGPKHKIKSPFRTGVPIDIEDDTEYEEGDITDEKFIEMLEANKAAS